MGGGLYCLLALGFTFVWWSSRTFFITAGGFVILGGVVTHTLAMHFGWPFLVSAAVAILFCGIMGILVEVCLFERYARRLAVETRISSGGSFGGVVLDTAIVSFALYVFLVNLVQWCFGGMTDSISLRPATAEEFTNYSLFGLAFGIRTNRLGLWQLVLCWASSFLLIATLSSQVGLKLRAVKSNFALFDQITGQGRKIRLFSYALCSAASAFAGNILLTTSRLDIDGGMTVILGAMVVMILGTQSKSLWMVPIFSLLFAGTAAVLQALGFSLWVEPITVAFLLAMLVVGPKSIISDAKRAEELAEA